MIKVGIVGAGGIGGWHAERWRQMPVELAAFYDIELERAETMAARYGGRAYDSVAELVSAVDLVDVCTVTTAHKEGVLAAAAARKAVICEKPLALTVADGEEMIAACAAAGVPLFVAQVVRFFPQFARAKAVLDAGDIGEPGVIRTMRAGSAPYLTGRKWFGDLSLSGGVMMDMGVHDIDFVRWCMGEVERVYAVGNQGGLDHVLLTLRFASGAVGHIESSWLHPAGEFRTAFEIAGTEGLLEWDSQNDRPVQVGVAGPAGMERRRESPLAPEDDPYYAELAHFLDCLENGTPCRVTPQDGLMAVKVARAALASLERGEPVTLAEFKEVAS